MLLPVTALRLTIRYIISFAGPDALVSFTYAFRSFPFCTVGDKENSKEEETAAAAEPAKDEEEGEEAEGAGEGDKKKRRKKKKKGKQWHDNMQNM